MLSATPMPLPSKPTRCEGTDRAVRIVQNVGRIDGASRGKPLGPMNMRKHTLKFFGRAGSCLSGSDGARISRGPALSYRRP